MQRCPKCNGAMIREKFYDRSFESFIGDRCVNCGTITDPLIEEHRLHGYTGPKKRYLGEGFVCKGHKGVEG